MAALWLTGCSSSAAPITGTVVDAETGEPLEGVIVVVAWRLITGPHGQTVGFLVLDEAVTDAEGRFAVPGWKGKRSPALAALTKTSPEMRFVKEGYWNGFWLNDRVHPMGSPLTFPRRSDWSGEIFELKPFKGEPKEYFGVIGGVGEYFTDNPACAVKRLPKLTAEIERLNAKAKQMELRHWSLPALGFYARQICREDNR